MTLNTRQGNGAFVVVNDNLEMTRKAVKTDAGNLFGAYRDRVLEALPECRVTEDIDIVEGFFKGKKPQEYFMQNYASGGLNP